MNRINGISASLAVLVTLFFAAAAQAQVATGGSYIIDQAVIAAGGGTSTDPANTTYKVEGTSGQPAAGQTSSGSSYTLRSGFWNSSSLAPTAAGVLIGGRVLSTSGVGISNALITLTGSDGVTRSVRTGSFGFYSFDNVRSGETYILNASRKGYVFAPVVVSVSDNLTGLNLIAVE